MARRSGERGRERLTGGILRGFCLQDTGAWPDGGVSERVPWPGRNYFLYGGPLETALARVKEPCSYQSPNIWGPDDRAWIVATDGELDSTYIAGAESLLTRLMADPRLEVLPARLDDVVLPIGDEIDATLAMVRTPLR